MNQPLYIKSACSISPQHTYDEENFLRPVEEYEDGMMYVIDPDYSKYISPVAIRRMSRMLKRGITAGMRSLDNAKITTPDAIIIGTARGSVIDMEVFVKDMINLNEQALNPSSFIQSTYNSVNGWIAMQTKCTAYNQTFVHRGFSFELCLLDAQLLLSESAEKKNLLVGGFDELTTEYAIIRGKIGYYKKQVPKNTELYAHADTPGSIAGEGAHFFTVSNDAAGAICAMHDVAMLLKPTWETLHEEISNMLNKQGLVMADVDVLLCGMNGDSRTTFLTDSLMASFDERTTVANFKHLSGEYDTASGFGLWLANYIFKKQQVPSEVTYRKGNPGNIKNMLLCNITITGNATLMLISAK